MLEDKKTTELNENELEKVNGGGSGTYNGVTYNDGDTFCEKSENFSTESYVVYILKNCTWDSVDIDYYYYNQKTKVATYWYPYRTGYSYGFLDNLKKIDIEILQFN